MSWDKFPQSRTQLLITEFKQVRHFTRGLRGWQEASLKPSTAPLLRLGLPRIKMSYSEHRRSVIGWEEKRRMLRKRISVEIRRILPIKYADLKLSSIGNMRVALIIGLQYADLKLLLAVWEPPKGFGLRLLNGSVVSTLLNKSDFWEAKRQSVKDAITGQPISHDDRKPTLDVALRATGRRLRWLCHTHHLELQPEIRQALMTYVRLSSDLLFGEVRDLDSRKTAETATDRGNWTNSDLQSAACLLMALKLKAQVA